MAISTTHTPVHSSSCHLNSRFPLLLQANLSQQEKIKPITVTVLKHSVWGRVEQFKRVLLISCLSSVRWVRILFGYKRTSAMKGNVRLAIQRSLALQGSIHVLLPASLHGVFTGQCSFQHAIAGLGCSCISRTAVIRLCESVHCRNLFTIVVLSSIVCVNNTSIDASDAHNKLKKHPEEYVHYLCLSKKLQSKLYADYGLR